MRSRFTTTGWFSSMQVNPALARSAATLGVCFLLFSGLLPADTLVIQPTQLKLAATKPVADLLLRNDGTEERIYAVTINSWQQVGGVDQLDPSGKLIVHPQTVRLQPGETSTVRVGLKMSGPLWEEQAFQVQLTEVPQAPDVGSGMSWFAKKSKRHVNVPVFLLPPGAANPRISWHASRNPGGMITLKASNSGRGHVQLYSASLAGPDGQLIEMRDLATVILPGGSRWWKLADNATGGLWRVTADTSTGPMEADLQIEPGLSTSSSVSLAE